METAFNLDQSIRKVKDFPKEGVLFYDITSILTNPDAFSYCIEKMVDIYKNKKIDAVAAAEARGFLFAAPFCEKLGIPLILIRKKGKLPGKVLTKTYALEYGEDSIQIHKDDIPQGGNVLLVDDLIATGGTLKAAKELLEEGGAKVDKAFGIVGLPFLNYSQVLEGMDVVTLINYDSE
ncbi:MAG: adenine phosphoribosyltransferase [Spirochaetales bacterium]|nr:adenine phosphoribosyltransferase [Spirochaetales bacterium]